MTLNSILLADLPYNLSKLTTGYTDATQYQRDNLYYLAIVSGQAKLASLANDYAASYDSQSPTTVLAYRDFLLSQAIIYSLQTVMYTDSTKTQLTGTAEKSLERYGLGTLFYPDSLLDANNNLSSRYAGFLGTVAYYFLFVKASGYPIDYFNELLTFIWEINGCDYNDPPRVRIDKLLKFLHTSNYNDQTVSIAVTNLFTNVISSSDPLYPILLYARRSYLSLEDGKNFTANVLAGTYSLSLLTVLSEILTEEQYKVISSYADSVLTICAPVGIPLLMQALIVESFVRAAEVLTNLPSQVANQGLGNFLSNPTSNQVSISAVYNWLVTAYNAQDYLINKVGITPPATQDLASLIQTWSGSSTQPNPDYTLSNLTNPPPPESVAVIYSDLALNQLKTLATSGVNTYKVTASSGVGNPIIYVAINYSQKIPPTIIFVSSSPSNSIVVEEITKGTSNLQSIPLITNKPTDSLGVTRVAVTNNSGNPLLALALDGNIQNISTGDVLSPSQVVAVLKSSNTSYSSPVITSPNYTPTTQLQIAYNSLNNQQDNYLTYNVITTTSLPRGSIADSYAVLGLNYSSVTAQQSLDYAQSMWLGAVQEFTGRICYLSKQMQNNQANNEIKWVTNYVTNLLPSATSSKFSVFDLPPNGLTINKSTYTPPSKSS